MICLSEKYRQKYSKRLRTLYLIISWTTCRRKNRTKKMTTISWRLSNLPKYANFQYATFSYTFRIPNVNTRHLCLKSNVIMNRVIHLILGLQIENGKHTVNSKKSYVVSTPSCFCVCILVKSNFDFHPFFK